MEPGSLALTQVDRRRLLLGTFGCAAYNSLSGCSPIGDLSAATNRFTPIEPNSDDRITLPAGYESHVVLRWGDPIFAGAAPLDAAAVRDGALLRAGAAEQQSQQFGYNCDGLGIVELGPGRLLLCANHEYPLPELMFPGWLAARESEALRDYLARHTGCVPYMQASVGVSVVELRRREGRWSLVSDSPYNRRVTANTETVFTGPAQRHALLGGTAQSDAIGRGTLGNCAAGTTPWKTYLTAEENIDHFFGNGAQATFEPDLARAHRRFGYRRRNSRYRWEYHDTRFDMAGYPREALKFGWIVEIDPADPRAPVKKRTALGRFKHEGATATLAADRRVAVYMGDDQEFECFYKFVTDKTYDPSNPDANRDLLDSGTLYVARLHGDGSGEWLPLTWSADGPLSPRTGFESQADVVLHCREAADRLGGTPLDRPEDVAVNETTKRVYLSCTQNLSRGGDREAFAGRQVDSAVDGASPRAVNRFGHILELAEDNDDSAAQSFRWQVFVLAGAPSRARLALRVEVPMTAESTYFGGFASPADLSAFANPDNLTFDARGNLWIVTDGRQPNGGNNGCFACPTDGEFRGQVLQFMCGPVGAEISGCEITSDDETLFLTVQHPGEGGSIERPRSEWPDRGGAAPRPSLIAIEPTVAGVKLGERSG